MKAVALLCLVALPLLAAAQFYTDEELDGIASNCNVSLIFTEAACQACVYTLGGPTSTIQLSGKAWACSGLCQKDTVVTSATLAAPCETCLNYQETTVYGCEACLKDATVATATSCFTCLRANPLVTYPNLRYLDDDYYTACAACSKLTNAPAQAQCFTCISTWDARAQSAGGFLTRDEMINYVQRPNDFGACVALANNTQNINTNVFSGITGIQASCIPQNLSTIPSLPLSPASCMTCISNVAAATYPDQPSYLRKEFGCYAYCQKAPTSTLAATCVTCLQNEFPQDAWGCGNCLNPLFDSATCFSCVGADPYRGRTSNYNWACGQCSAISNLALRALCIQCIQSQPLPDFTNPTAAATGVFNRSTEANICSCIDLTLNSTISINRVLDAQERACFEPQVYFNTATPPALVTPDIPWGNVTDSTGTTSACLGCIAAASANSPNQGLNKKYACTQYCQDPRLVDGIVQGEACATCVAHPLVADPSGCKMCMEATTDNTERDICFACVETPNSYSNKAWGCSQCTMLSDSDASDACFRCLALGDRDPCVCVDLAKNGTLTSGVQAGCEPSKIRAWVWVAPLTSFAQLDFSLDIGNAMGPNAVGPAPPLGTHIVDGTSTSTYNIFTNNLGFRIVAVTIDFDAPPVIPRDTNDIWLSLYNARTPSGARALVYWDFSQLPAGPDTWVSVDYRGDNVFPAWDVQPYSTGISRHAFQLIDSCGAVLVDTISRTPFINTNYQANAYGVSEAFPLSGFGSRFNVPSVAPDLKVATLYRNCMIFGGSLGWSVHIGPGTYTGPQLDALAPTGNKRDLSSFIITNPNYKLILYRDASCTGSIFIEFTTSQVCLLTVPYPPFPFGGTWNDKMNCIKVVTI